MPGEKSTQSSQNRTRHRFAHPATYPKATPPSAHHSVASASRSRRQGRRTRGVMQALDGAAERTVRVIWVRHGETADNARHIIQVGLLGSYDYQDSAAETPVNRDT